MVCYILYKHVYHGFLFSWYALARQQMVDAYR
jgi:hypothetical protein